MGIMITITGDFDGNYDKKLSRGYDLDFINSG